MSRMRNFSNQNARTAVALALLFALVLIVSRLYVDHAAALYFHSLAGADLLISLSHDVTNAGLSGWYLCGSAAVFAYCKYVKKHPALARTAVLIFTTTAVSGLTCDVLKSIFGRSRPELLFLNGTDHFSWWIINGKWNSFPSGHATTIASVTSMLFLLCRKPWLRVLIATLGVCLISTRVIVTVHYVSDVLAGATLGTLCSVLIFEGHHKTLALAIARAFARLRLQSAPKVRFNPKIRFPASQINQSAK
jgi:membrane-associated phospholipid phosphatase